VPRISIPGCMKRPWTRRKQSSLWILTCSLTAITWQVSLGRWFKEQTLTLKPYSLCQTIGSINHGMSKFPSGCGFTSANLIVPCRTTCPRASGMPGSSSNKQSKGTDIHTSIDMFRRWNVGTWKSPSGAGQRYVSHAFYLDLWVLWCPEIDTAGTR
jgi:hypothetical protein